MPIHVDISFDETEPPTGTVAGPGGGDQRSFVGWLELMSAIAGLVGPDRSGSEDLGDGGGVDRR